MNRPSLFYRQKYDAQQVLARFAQTARDETGMAALQAELLRVVQETMQPEQVSVWLKPESGGERPFSLTDCLITLLGKAAILNIENCRMKGRDD